MSRRDSRLRRRRTEGLSTRQLAREFGISQPQVRRVLAATGGDPLRGSDLAAATVVELEGERDRLRDRIAADRRRLRVVLDELEARRTDRILGLTG